MATEIVIENNTFDITITELSNSVAVNETNLTVDITEQILETIVTISNEQGAVGATGAAGATGNTGPTGPQGPTGPAGSVNSVTAADTTITVSNTLIDPKIAVNTLVIAPLASPTFTGTVTVPTPTNATDAANKLYVDTAAAGLNVHGSVGAASTANVTGIYIDGTTGADGGLGVGATFTTTATGAFTLDSNVIVLGERILLKNQTTQKQNGVYTCTTAGATGVSAVFTRATDSDNHIAGQVVAGDFTFVAGGGQANTAWIQTAIGNATTPTDGIKLGFDSLVFSQFSAGTTYTAGTGINATSLGSGTIAVSTIPITNGGTGVSNATAPTGQFLAGTGTAFSPRAIAFSDLSTTTPTVVDTMGVGSVLFTTSPASSVSIPTTITTAQTSTSSSFIVSAYGVSASTPLGSDGLIKVGWYVTGNNIPYGTTVATVSGALATAQTITLSKNTVSSLTTSDTPVFSATPLSYGLLAPSATALKYWRWIINHNAGRRMPAVSIFDSSNANSFIPFASYASYTQPIDYANTSYATFSESTTTATATANATIGVTQIVFATAVANVKSGWRITGAGMGNHASSIVTVKTTDNKTFTLWNSTGTATYATTAAITASIYTFTPAKYSGAFTGYVMG